MFNWFKKKDRKKAILDEWHFEGVSEFKMIQNRDSIQYINEDAGKWIFFSVLTVKGGDLSPVNAYIDNVIVSEDTNGWHIKGAKKFKNQLLICVITINNIADIEWAKSFFASIKERTLS